MGKPRFHQGADGWSTIAPYSLKQQAKAESKALYSSIVRNGMGQQDKQQPAQQQQQQQQQQQRQQPHRSKDNGCYVVCSKDGCKGFSYTSSMAKEDIKCKLCNTLYPRDWLSRDQQAHWDAMAKSRGIAGTAAAPDEKSLDVQMEADIDDLDSGTNGKGEDKDGLQGDEVQRTLAEPQEDLKAAERSHDFVEKLDGVDPTTHGNMCNQLLGKVNRIKERIKAAEDKEPSSKSDEARKLNKDLNQAFAAQKADKERESKWEAKAAQLEQEAEEARVHARVYKANGEAHQAKVQAISQKLAQLTSAQPPDVEAIEESVDEAKAVEEARQLEIKEHVEKALRDQQAYMFAAFQIQLQQAVQAAQGGAQPVPAAASGSTAEVPGTEAITESDLLKKMGEDCKKKASGLATKAAASVKSTILKGKDKQKGKEKLSGKVADAVAEAQQIADNVTEILQK